MTRIRRKANLNQQKRRKLKKTFTFLLDSLKKQLPLHPETQSYVFFEKILI